jgi:hypothetical protein
MVILFAVLSFGCNSNMKRELVALRADAAALELRVDSLMHAEPVPPAEPLLCVYELKAFLRGGMVVGEVVSSRPIVKGDRLAVDGAEWTVVSTSRPTGIEADYDAGAVRKYELQVAFGGRGR